MISFFKKLPLALKTGLLWARILEDIERGRYQESLAKLDTIHRTPSTGIEIDLAKAQALHGLGRSDECYDICLQVLAYAPSLKKSEHDILYCLEYAKWLMAHNHQKTNIFKDSAPPAVNDISLRRVDLRKVDVSLKRNFQLFIHPDWDVKNVKGLQHN
jgi:hypothetical protein